MARKKKQLPKSDGTYGPEQPNGGLIPQIFFAVSTVVFLAQGLTKAFDPIWILVPPAVFILGFIVWGIHENCSRR